jgi:uncharacterized protein with NAD-binding domain and iron-sulfur cluster
MNKTTIAELEQKARNIVDRVSDNPEDRYQLRVSFYKKYGFGGENDLGYGDSELAFLRWEIDRGVLNNMHDTANSGSAWWRAVNSDFIYNSELAGLIYEAGIPSIGVSDQVAYWLNYIQNPSPVSWYKAHNSSIIAGYLDHTEKAHTEGKPEQLFTNIVLYRLLFAQVMVEDPYHDLIGKLARTIASPSSPAVNILVHIPDFYPRHYPLTSADIANVTHKSHHLMNIPEDILDEWIILPHLNELYHLIALKLNIPPLENLQDENKPIYPDIIKQQKIAILGGGVGAITTAFALTNPDNPKRAQYDITLYQMGWRLGGKGASGRNTDPEYHDRIQEHGLHIWFGFYDNAFKHMRQCYDELTKPYGPKGSLLRAPDAPLANWREAFKPHGSAFIAEEFKGNWHQWHSVMPVNDQVPGDGELLPLWSYLELAIDMMFKVFHNSTTTDPITGDVDLKFPEGRTRKINKLGSWMDTLILKFFEYTLKTLPSVAKLIDSGGKLLIKLMTIWMRWHWNRVKNEVETNIQKRQGWIILNFAYAQIKGAFVDNLFEKGIDSINHLDYREWISRHAFDDNGLMINSAFLLSVYDGSFAYINGDNSTPPGAHFPPNGNMEAGTTLRAGIRFALTYKGAPVWKMQAGMGDTVFGPYYQVLKRRGVKFEFFSRVKEVIPSEDCSSIEKIIIEKQATVKDGEYRPFVDIKGLPCWPAKPLYDQLEEGKELRERNIDLESYCEDWHPVETITLKEGESFDKVVLGISIGALPYICGDLIKSSKKWKDMVDNIVTIRTQALQLWLKPTAYELGWKLMQQPVLSGFDYRSSNPLETWGDMSHLIDKESWESNNYPQNIAYFCSSMIENPPLQPSPTGPMASCEQMNQKKANEEVFQQSLKLLKSKIKIIFPNVMKTDPEGQEAFNWDLLVDDREGNHSGEERLRSQFWLGNVKPSERYVLSVAGSSKYRLRANDPKLFANLYLSGDWTYSHLNYGCVEGATMSGLFAANAVSGLPEDHGIIGLDF